jgi:HPt (histidine-containing phosphotransfer) domain-containing protein
MNDAARKLHLAHSNRQVQDHGLAPAINRGYLARFTLGNADLEREVLELFAGQAPLYLAKLAGADTLQAWRDAAHTLKGSAAAVGALRVAQIAELAERLDITAPEAPAEACRERAVAAVATAVEEACQAIAQIYPAP